MSNVEAELLPEEYEEPVKDLSVQEKYRLEQLEGIVVDSVKSFYNLGMALTEIRDRKLYRKKAKTFEKYCKELFEISRRRAYEMISAAGVIENVRNCAQNIPSLGEDEEFNPIDFFVNESQLRPLTKLRPEDQVSACLAAIETAPNGKITAGHVKKIVKDYLGENINKTVRKAREKGNEQGSDKFMVAFNAFADQITAARKNRYKETSRGYIVRTLDQLRAEVAADGEFIEDSIVHGGGDDWNKLERAGFKLFRMDRSSMTIKVRSEGGGWKKESGPFETVKSMEESFRDLLQDDMHLRG